MWYNQNYLNSVTGLKLKIKIRKVGEGYGKSTQGESAGDSGMCPDNVCYNGHVIHMECQRGQSKDAVCYGQR